MQVLRIALLWILLLLNILNSRSATAADDPIIDMAYSWYDSLMLGHDSNPREALGYGLRIIDIADEIPDTLVHFVRLQMGNILDRQGFTSQALDFYNDAYLGLRERGLEHMTGWLNIDIGNVHFHQQNFKPALEKYKLAARLFADDKYDAGLYTSYNNMGLVFLSQGFYSKARESFRKSQKLAQGSLADIPYLQALSFKYIADLHLALDHQDSAQAFLDSALKVKYTDRDILHRDELLENLANIWLLKGDTAKAIAYLEVAAFESSQNHDVYVEINVNRQLAALYHAQGQTEKAISFLRQAAERCQHGGAIDAGISIQTELIKYFGFGKNVLAQKREYEHLIKLQNLRYEALLQENEQRYAIQELLHEYSQRLQEQAASLSRSDLIRNALFIIGILLIGLIWVLFKSMMKSQKARDELGQSNMALQEAVDSKNKLFSIIAHDLRSPFNVLMGYSDLLKEEYESFEESQRKTIILEMAGVIGNAFRLLENLLEWSRAQTNRIRYQPEAFPLRPLIVDLATFTSETFGKKHISVIVDEVEEIDVLADKNMLSTILRNLLSNAGKFSESGRKIMIRTTLRGERVHISVMDEGIGISPDKIDTLFDPTVNVSSTGTHNEPGTGLGLSLCKEFVEMHGGEITVNSTLGDGTNFSFTIPAK